MSDENKPSEDLKEGFRLLFRAASTTVKQVDVSKIDKTLDKAFSQASRVATNVGRAVAEEYNRITKTPPPWAARQDKDRTDDATATSTPEEEGDGRERTGDAKE